jgi:hypothetical protein
VDRRSGGFCYELDPVRVADFEAAKTEVIGENENAMFTSAGD